MSSKLNFPKIDGQKICLERHLKTFPEGFLILTEPLVAGAFERKNGRVEFQGFVVF